MNSQKLIYVLQIRFELYLLLAAIMMTLAIVPQHIRGDNPSNNVSQEEHQQLLTDVERQDTRIDQIQSRQIDIYAKVTVLEKQVSELHELAERREGLLDTMMIGIAVLIVEMALRGIFKIRSLGVMPYPEK